MRKIILRFVYVVPFMLSTLFLTAQDSIITFKAILIEGMNNNYNLQIKSLNLVNSDYVIMRAKGMLSPYLNTELTTGLGVDPTITNDGTSYAITSLIVPTKFGVDFYAGLKAEHTGLISDDIINNNAGYWVGASMPLLRDLGKNNQLNSYIRTSELNKKALEEELSSEIVIYFSNVLISFLELNRQSEQYLIKNIACDEAVKYKGNIYTLIENDLLPKVEKNKADAFFLQQDLQRSSKMLNLRNAYYDIEQLLGSENIKFSTSMPKIIESVPEIDVELITKFVASNKQRINQLIPNTPQYKNITYKIEEEKIMLDYSKNQKKNPLVLDVRASYFGMYPNGNYNFFNAFSSTYPGYSFLFSLKHTFPVNNQQKKAEYLTQLNSYETSVTYLDQFVFESQLNALRLIKNIEQLLDIYKQNEILTDLMKQSYLDELEKFKYDNSTQMDAITSYQNYHDSQLLLNDLKYDIYIAIVQLKAIIGDLPRTKSEIESFSFQTFFLFN